MTTRHQEARSSGFRSRSSTTDNFGLLDELLSPEFVDHFPQPGVAPTREGFKQSAMALRNAFPDIRTRSTIRSPPATRSCIA